jgi:2,4-dienoyl-CoA reductase-like NADH-dependent reductase (Old Yellow Enzyme family)
MALVDAQEGADFSDAIQRAVQVGSDGVEGSVRYIIELRECEA